MYKREVAELGCQLLSFIFLFNILGHSECMILEFKLNNNLHYLDKIKKSNMQSYRFQQFQNCLFVDERVDDYLTYTTTYTHTRAQRIFFEAILFF